MHAEAGEPRASGYPARPPLEPGLQVGRYRLQALLGRGAMGEVYRAHDLQLGRQVALKFLSRLDGPRLERFRREAELMGKLVHPGIVRLHSFDAAHGMPFLVCELIEAAQPLQVAFRTRDLRQRVALVRDAARALGYAHAQGVVHRDVKPDNVLVGSDGAGRVSDFGLALDLELDTHRLTRSGALVGTPHYMAPEQISGERQAVGPWSDVWALGVILYEACQGVRPFLGETLLALSAQITSTRPSPLGAEARGLQGVVTRALAKRPEERYPTAEGLADDLQGWLEGPLAPPRSLARRVAGLSLAVALGLGGLVSLRGATVPEAPGARPGPPRRPPPPEARPAPQPPSQRLLEQVSQGGAAARLVAAHDFLLAHPDHPDAPRVEAVLQDLAARLPLAVLPVPPGRLERPTWDGDTLLAPDPERLVRYGPTGQVLASLPLPISASALIAPLGPRWLVSSMRPAGVHCVLADLRGSEAWPDLAPASDLIPDPRGNYLALTDESVLRVIDRQGQVTCQRELPEHHKPEAATFTPDGRHLLYVDRYVDPIDDLNETTDLVLLQLPHGVEVGRQRTQPVLRLLSYGPGGRLALGTRAGGLFVVGPVTDGVFPGSASWTQLRPTGTSEGDPEQFLGVAHPGGVDALAWTPEGQLLSAGQHRDEGPCLLRRWDVDGERELLPARPLPPYPVDSIEASPTGRYILVTQHERPPFVLLGATGRRWAGR